MCSSLPIEIKMQLYMKFREIKWRFLGSKSWESHSMKARRKKREKTRSGRMKFKLKKKARDYNAQLWCAGQSCTVEQRGPTTSCDLSTFDIPWESCSTIIDPVLFSFVSLSIFIAIISRSALRAVLCVQRVCERKKVRKKARKRGKHVVERKAIK